MNWISSYRVFYSLSINVSQYVFNCFLDKIKYHLKKDTNTPKLSNFDKFLINTCESLKDINIFYIKAIQALSGNNELFSEHVINYMTEFSDRVPFQPDEFNLNEIKEVLTGMSLYLGMGNT